MTKSKKLELAQKAAGCKDCILAKPCRVQDRCSSWDSALDAINLTLAAMKRAPRHKPSSPKGGAV